MTVADLREFREKGKGKRPRRITVRQREIRIRVKERTVRGG